MLRVAPRHHCDPLIAMGQSTGRWATSRMGCRTVVLMCRGEEEKQRKGRQASRGLRRIQPVAGLDMMIDFQPLHSAASPRLRANGRGHGPARMLADIRAGGATSAAFPKVVSPQWRDAEIDVTSFEEATRSSLPLRGQRSLEWR